VKNAKEVYDRFEIENILEGLKPRWNVRPGQMNPIVTSQSPNQISRMFWGLIPHFAVDENYEYKTINAKAETARMTKLPNQRAGDNIGKNLRGIFHVVTPAFQG
jgi:putative SOS response-associated peptidase YedK